MINDKDLLEFLMLVVTPTLLATTIGFAVAWVRARERALRAENARVGLPEAPDSVARVEQALGAVAVEVERIGEHQRYLTRVLAERSAEPH